MNIHRKYILRCIEIAQNGLGTTAPNPMVGCVIVCQDKIIGEGYTSPYGGPHAEVNAINSVKDKALLKLSTLYVTLEPCSHYGKTPPCADLIVRHKIPKVVIGIGDTNEKVSGKGVKKLKDAGCEVLIGVLEQECKTHHKRFFTFQDKKRPFIVLKWAETSNGYIAPDKSKRDGNLKPYWITNQNSRQLVHQWRSEEQAILVGTKTVMDDNPKLDVRHWTGSPPIRIILDKDLKIEGNYHVLDGSIKTIILTEVLDKTHYKKEIIYEVIDFSKNVAQQICEILFNHNIISVIIEGGKQTLETFITENLWDEARVFTGTATFENGLKAPELSATRISSKNINGDILNTYIDD